jgi:hypothetical protein
MQDREYAARIEAVKQRAHGRWMEILASLGVDERILKRRNLPARCAVARIGSSTPTSSARETITAANAAPVAASSCKPSWRGLQHRAA